MLSVMAPVGGVLGRRLSNEGGALMHGVRALISMPFLHMRTQWEGAAKNLETSRHRKVTGTAP